MSLTSLIAGYNLGNNIIIIPRVGIKYSNIRPIELACSQEKYNTIIDKFNLVVDNYGSFWALARHMFIGISAGGLVGLIISLIDGIMLFSWGVIWAMILLAGGTTGVFHTSIFDYRMNNKCSQINSTLSGDKFQFRYDSRLGLYIKYKN